MVSLNSIQVQLNVFNIVTSFPVEESRRCYISVNTRVVSHRQQCRSSCWLQFGSRFEGNVRGSRRFPDLRKRETWSRVPQLLSQSRHECECWCSESVNIQEKNNTKNLERKGFQEMSCSRGLSRFISATSSNEHWNCGHTLAIVLRDHSGAIWKTAKLQRLQKESCFVLTWKSFCLVAEVLKSRLQRERTAQRPLWQKTEAKW